FKQRHWGITLPFWRQPLILVTLLSAADSWIPAQRQGLPRAVPAYCLGDRQVKFMGPATKDDTYRAGGAGRFISIHRCRPCSIIVSRREENMIRVASIGYGDIAQRSRFPELLALGDRARLVAIAG